MKRLWIFQLIITLFLVGCGTPEGDGTTSDTTTEEPATEEPTTEEPAAEEPTTEEPDTNEETVSVPGTVDDLSAEPREGSVNLTWTEVEGADTYTVYYALESMADLTNLSDVISLSDGRTVGALTGSSQLIENLTNNMEYFFMMTATNSAGESDRGVEVSATPTVNITPQNLVAVAGNQRVELTWDEVTDVESYNVYHATESFEALTDITNYATLSGGTLIPSVTNLVLNVSGLTNDVPYFFVVTAVDAGENESPASVEATATPSVSATTATFRVIPDTGIDFGINFPDYVADPNASGSHNSDCSGTFFEQQDCSVGLDATNNDSEDGFAGFSYTKLDSLGSPLAADETFWNCVQDDVTGLVWEVKQGGNKFKGDQGLHDADDIFSWYNADIAENGRDSGGEDTQPLACFGYTESSENFCNTSAFVDRVNASKLCGKTNWRLPTPNELFGLVHFGEGSPSINADYFPNTEPGTKVWTNGSDPENTESHQAWVVLFDVDNAATLTGGSLIFSESKVAGRSVRLVSGD